MRMPRPPAFQFEFYFQWVVQCVRVSIPCRRYPEIHTQIGRIGRHETALLRRVVSGTEVIEVGFGVAFFAGEFVGGPGFLDGSPRAPSGALQRPTWGDVSPLLPVPQAPSFRRSPLTDCCRHHQFSHSKRQLVFPFSTSISTGHPDSRSCLMNSTKSLAMLFAPSPMEA